SSIRVRPAESDRLSGNPARRAGGRRRCQQSRRDPLMRCSWLALVLLLLSPALPGQVTYNRIAHAIEEPQNWLTYWGDYTAIRHRNLNQITTKNVKDLRLAWMFQSG